VYTEATHTDTLSLPTVQTITIADDTADAGPAPQEIDPTSSHIECVCEDPQGCDLTLDDTPSVADTGFVVHILAGTGADPGCQFDSLDGTQQVKGIEPFEMVGLGENISFIRTSYGEWQQLGDFLNH
jgi:hypothetical protein